MDHSLFLMVSPRDDTLRVSEAGDQSVRVHGMCTWERRVNLRVVYKLGGWDKAASSHGVSVRRVYIPYWFTYGLSEDRTILITTATRPVTYL